MSSGCFESKFSALLRNEPPFEAFRGLIESYSRKYDRLLLPLRIPARFRPINRVDAVFVEGKYGIRSDIDSEGNELIGIG